MLPPGWAGGSIIRAMTLVLGLLFAGNWFFRFASLLGERISTTINGSASQIAFNAKQLIIFSSSFSAARGTSFYLSAIGGNSEIGNGGVLGFT